jgi:drug/metabolite transporter (DMT)-like permease
MMLILPLSWVFSKYCVEEYGTVNTVYYRVIFTALSLIFLSVIMKKNLIKGLINDFFGLFFLSIFGFVAYFYFVTLSLDVSLPSQTGLCMALLPSIGYILSLITSQEKFDSYKIFGLIFGISGALVFYSSNDVFNDTTGLIYSLIAVISYAIYGAIYQRKFKDKDNLEVLAQSSFLGSIFLTLIFISSGFNFFEKINYDNKVIIRDLFILAIFFTLPIYFLYQMVIKKNGLITANIIGLSTPYLIIIGELIFNLRDSLTIYETSSMALTTLGMALVLFNNQIKNIKFWNKNEQ